MLCVYSRAVVRGGAGGVLAPSEFRSSVDPIQPERVDYVHHIIMLAQPGWTFYMCKSKKESKKECSTHC